MSDINDLTHEETIDQLRAKADEVTRATRELDLAKREIAFVRAGVPTESKPAQAFIRDYEGELTTDAIHQAAVEWNLWKPEGSDATSEEPDPTSVDRDKLRSGSQPSDAEPPSPHPSVKGLEEFRELRAAGINREDASIALISRLVKGGVEGDERIIIPDHGVQRVYEHRDIPYQDGRARRS
jgi:hypothetical protein